MNLNNIRQTIRDSNLCSSEHLENILKDTVDSYIDDMVEKTVDSLFEKKPNLSNLELIREATSIINNDFVNKIPVESERKRKSIRKILKSKTSINEQNNKDFFRLLNGANLILKASKIKKIPVDKLSLEEAESIISEHETKKIEEQSARADKIMNELILEEKQAKKRRKRRRKKTSVTKINTSRQKLSSETKIKTKKISQTQKTQKNSGRWINGLNSRKATIKELPRVRRWACKDVNIIRNFEDTIKGKQIKKYVDKSDGEIIKQRAYHYFPGIQKLFRDDKIKERYTFPTNRGLGLFADLERNKIQEHGILYFGIDKKINSIFHCYFEPFKKSITVEELFHDKENVSQKDNDLKNQDWKIQGSCQFVLKKDGCLKVNFQDEEHVLTIHPFLRTCSKSFQ